MSTAEQELEILMDELREWESSMEFSWTPEDKAQYLKKKLENVNNFLMDQVTYWEGVIAARPAGGAAPAPEPTPEPAPKPVEATPAPTPEPVREPEPVAASPVDEEAALEAEAARLAAAELAAEEAATKAAAAKAAADKAAADKAASDKVAAEKAAADKAAADKAASEKAAAAKAAADKAAADRLAAEKEKAAAEKAAADKAAADRAAAAAAATPVVSNVPVKVASADIPEDDSAQQAERKDAILRIGRPPKGACDLTDPSVLEAYLRTRNHSDPLNWFVLGYAPGSNCKLVVIACGETGFDEMKAALVEDACFMYIDFKFGDTQRSKFIFMTYVPDSLGGLKKSRVVGHRPAVEKFLKYITLQWHVLDKGEMGRDVLEKKLLAAGGANYSVQESNKGDFSSYKQTTKEFYEKTDKETQIGGIVFQQGPLTVTPMDISGRSMVAAQSEFRGNTRDLQTNK